MEALIPFFVLAVFGALVVVPGLAIAALVRTSRLERELRDLERVVRDVARREGRRSSPAPEAVAASTGEPPIARPEPASASTGEPAPARPVSRPAGPLPPPPRPRVPPRMPPSRAGGPPPDIPDFATSLGPKVLVASGAIFFVVFLGLFVKYAWENDWVGPTGRVLMGAAMGLALLALGIGMLRHEYRPLGQGLAGAGLAGLYLSAFAAHGFYDLIPREAAGALMAAITVSAVLLAVRLDARLLAALAWLGAYLTPVLLSTGEDKAMALFLYLALLDLGALALDHYKPWPETLPFAFLGTACLYGAWYGQFFRPARFGVAAFGLLLFTGLFVLGAARKQRGWSSSQSGLTVFALAAAGLASMAMGGTTDRPAGLLVLLLGQAGIAVLARTRWPLAEAVGLAGGAATVLAWLGAFFHPGREADAYLLALPLAGVYLVSLVVRGLVHEAGPPAGPGAASRHFEGPLVRADVATHFGAATLAWTVLYRVLYHTQPTALGLASLALAGLYLAIGLLARRAAGNDLLQIRTLLGLAAVFVTLAIPVQLGLHGITLAWALEGVVLLGLGLRFESPLTRTGAYAVLGLSVLRLWARHLPWHTGFAFTPVLNPGFGTWLVVVLALAAAALLVRRHPEREPVDDLMGPALSIAALGLLFWLLTGEVQSAFAAQAELARLAGDLGAAETAGRAGALALSVLWTLFATGLLATGLGLRHRPLFYAGYGLFAVTAFKVVFVDLAMLQTVYRMLSFLALAVLLMSGAYLNLRFRERLLPREAAP